jgi:hypothetical protein
MCGNVFSSYYFVDDVCVSTDSMTCYYPVGTEELNNSSIELFPNPTTNELKIQNAEFRIETVEVYDALGQRVCSQLETKDFKPQTSVDISQLRPGIYFVTITDKEKNTVTRKFVKL